jgi:hypothetical protein
MPNPLRGEADLSVGEKTYRLALDVNAFCAVEGLLKMKALEIVQAFTDSPDGMAVPRALLWASLQKHHEMTVWDAGELMGEVGLIETRAALSEALALMFGMEAEGKKRPNPPNPRKTRGTG